MSGAPGYDEFLARVIDDGIAAARADYAGADEDAKRWGSVAGFEACRGRAPQQLAELLTEAGRDAREALRRAHDRTLVGDDTAAANDYWYWRCRELEIGWVCNVVSAALMNVGLPVIVAPTARGVGKAAEILGVG